MDLSRLPNAVKDFEKLITEGRIYVDKTDLISMHDGERDEEMSCQ